MEESADLPSKPKRSFVAKVFSKRTLLFTLLGVGVFAWGFDRDPANFTEPMSFDRSPEYVNLPKHTIRVGTFNIHGGGGMDGVRDLDRTSSVMQGLDLVLMQEVYARSFSIRHDQATYLGDKLQMATLFVPAERRWWHNSYGNAILTKVAPTGMHRVPLITTQHCKFRTALLFNLPHEGRIIHFLMVHLDTRHDRQNQLKSICDLFLSLSEPAVLIGDLNTRMDDPKLEQLLTESSITDYITDGIKGSTKVKGVDWIIARGLKFADCGSVKTDASDHPLVWADLALPAMPPTAESSPAKTVASQTDLQTVNSGKR